MKTYPIIVIRLIKKMKKYNLIFALISLNFCLAFGQNISMTNGAVFGKESLLHKWVLVDKNDKVITIIENLAPYAQSDFYLKKLDRNTLQTISEKPLASMDYGPSYIGRLGENIITIDVRNMYKTKRLDILYRKHKLRNLENYGIHIKFRRYDYLQTLPLLFGIGCTGFRGWDTYWIRRLGAFIHSGSDSNR